MVLRDVPKELIKTAIYPSPEQLWEAVDFYITEEYSAFLDQFKNGPSLRLFYEKYIAKKVSFGKFYVNMLKSFNLNQSFF